MALKDLKLDDICATHSIYVTCKCPYAETSTFTLEISHNDEKQVDGETETEKPGWFMRILDCDDRTLVTSKNASAAQIRVKLIEFFSFLSLFNGTVTNITTQVDYDEMPTDKLSL